MNLNPQVFDLPAFYQYSHRVFSRKKLQYIQRYLENRRSTAPLKVVDLGCGPGTNSCLFVDRQEYHYVGVDINRKYIAWAQQRYDLKFVWGDITELREMAGAADLVLINSVMHHLSDLEANRALKAAQRMLAPDGECVVLDMIRPEHATALNSLQRALIRLDRGSFCRNLNQLEGLLSLYFETETAYSFDIRFIGVPLWNLKLIVCRNRTRLQENAVASQRRLERREGRREPPVG